MEKNTYLKIKQNLELLADHEMMAPVKPSIELAATLVAGAIGMIDTEMDPFVDQNIASAMMAFEWAINNSDGEVAKKLQSAYDTILPRLPASVKEARAQLEKEKAERAEKKAEEKAEEKTEEKAEEKTEEKKVQTAADRPPTKSEIIKFGKFWLSQSTEKKLELNDEFGWDFCEEAGELAIKYGQKPVPVMDKVTGAIESTAKILSAAATVGGFALYLTRRR